MQDSLAQIFGLVGGNGIADDADVTIGKEIKHVCAGVSTVLCYCFDLHLLCEGAARALGLRWELAGQNPSDPVFSVNEAEQLLEGDAAMQIEPAAETIEVL